MPSREIRRTPEVFGVVKVVDGARVLRSGRQVLRESGDGKLGKIKEPRPIENKRTLQRKYGKKQDGLAEIGNLNKGVIGRDGDRKTEVPEITTKEAVDDSGSVDRRFGNVYSRKRKISDTKSFKFSDRFVRRKRSKSSSESLVGLAPRDVACGSIRRVLTVAFESSCCSRNCWFSCFLYSILRYMKRARLRLSLSAFVSREPICSVYSSLGIHFFQDRPVSSGIGLCRIFGARQYIPLFYLDFYALPGCFMHLYLCMLLRKCLPFALVNNSKPTDTIEDIMNDIEDKQMCIPPEIDHKARVYVVHGSVNRLELHPSSRASELTCQIAQCRNGLTPPSFKKKRNRTRRARNLSVVGGDMNKFGRLALSSSTTISNRVNSTTKLPLDIYSCSCTANILVVESDKCYREEGAIVMLEISASREWLIVVKKNGSTRYFHKAQEVMRPCSCNHFTQSIIWACNNDWMLEFQHQEDWLIFKDLCKECSDRNIMLAATGNTIPVPGIWEVSSYEDNVSATFPKPDSYIKHSGDEVSRVLRKRNANYEMDYEDEEWLNELNNEFFANSEHHERVSAEKFELMIDALEKTFYCSPADTSDEATAHNLCLCACLGVGSREVVEAVHNYWMRKRKHKQSALPRVFQANLPKKPPLMPQRKRSSRQKRIQSTRGKHPNDLQSTEAERDALDEQKAMLKAEDAIAQLYKCEESAVLKRQKAQFLMETVDLASYKAVMAIRIAEAVRVYKLPDNAAAYILE